MSAPAQLELGKRAVATLTFTATVGEILGWDQRQASVMLVAGGHSAIEELRNRRGQVVRVTLEFP